MGWLRGHQHCLYHFLDHVAKAQPVRPDLADGIRLEEIMDAVKRSAAENHPVKL